MKRRTKPTKVSMSFKSKVIPLYNRRALPLWILEGFKAQSIIEDVNLNKSDEFIRYGCHVHPDNPSIVLNTLNTGSRTTESEARQILDFYDHLKRHNAKPRNVAVRFDEFNIARHLYWGRDGKDWCQETMAVFAEMLPDYDQELFAKIFSLTSPRVELRTNLANALKCYDVFHSKKKFRGVLPSVQVMLNDLRNGAFVFDNSTHSSRRKVINFTRTLLGDPDAIVVDSRIMEVFGIARVYRWDGAQYVLTPTKGEYDIIEKYIRLLARLTGYEPRQIISMLWAGKKALNIKNKTVNVREVLGQLLGKNNDDPF